MNKHVLTGLLVATLVSPSLPAQTAKLAFVDSEVILRELPEAQQAQRELESTVKTWQEELEKMATNIQREIEDYQKKRDMMQPQAREQKEREIGDLQQKAREYQAQKFDPRQGEVVNLREQKLAPIRERILKAIESVAREENFSFVFDKANDATVLYADAKFDLTYRVLDRLKRGPATPARGR